MEGSLGDEAGRAEELEERRAAAASANLHAHREMEGRWREMGGRWRGDEGDQGWEDGGEMKGYGGRWREMERDEGRWKAMEGDGGRWREMIEAREMMGDEGRWPTWWVPMWTLATLARITSIAGAKTEYSPGGSGQIR